METLTNEIQQFSGKCRETEESRERRNEVRRRIKDIASERHPDADVVIVGSCGNGFGTKSSDLDLTIIFSSGSAYNYAVIQNLWKIEEKMKKDKSSYKDVEVML